MIDNEVKWENAMRDLKIFGGCAVCANCDKKVYPLNGYCKLRGCCGYGSGKVKEDMWKYDKE
jgi:hypothetical protein